MKKVSIVKFNVNSFINAKNEVEQYARDLETKTRRFMDRLLDVGITVAQQRMQGSHFAPYIVFYKNLEIGSGEKVKGQLIATNMGDIISQWYKDDNSIEIEAVSPLLMAEFGSGRKAKNPHNVSGVGKGSFPNQTHADQNYWWYKDAFTDEWKKGFPTNPRQPMDGAYVQMIADITRIATEVFG